MSALEEPEIKITAENDQLKCSECDKIKQVIYFGGPRSGLILCAHCGKVLWHGKSSTPHGLNATNGRQPFSRTIVVGKKISSSRTIRLGYCPLS